MNNPDEYQTILESSTGIYKEKGSKFQSFAFPVTGIDKVNELLSRIRKEHHSAQHHCYAYMIGTDKTEYRVNDNGEPLNTAGKPILGQIMSYGLTNVLVIVVRYFGGTLLGKGRLIQAYKSAAADALNNAKIIHATYKEVFHISFDYRHLGTIMKIIDNENLEIISRDFGQTAEIKVKIRKSRAAAIVDRLRLIEEVKIKQQENS